MLNLIPGSPSWSGPTEFTHSGAFVFGFCAVSEFIFEKRGKSDALAPRGERDRLNSFRMFDKVFTSSLYFAGLLSVLFATHFVNFCHGDIPIFGVE